ncbi:MAG TPA: MEDS domain-containing protein [Geomonas sp.]|nr:MEDS domain-containing protein [Geomonas sp.]
MLDREPVQLPGLEEVVRHDHLCLFYESEVELPTPLTLFVQKGLSLGERSLFLSAGDECLERLLNNAISGESQEGYALKLVSLQDGWLMGGRLDVMRVMGVLEGAINQSAEDGYKSTRIICDTRSLASDPAALNFLPEFELALDSLVEQQNATALCLYHRPCFPARVLLELGRLHRNLLVSGKICRNPLHVAFNAGPKASRSTLEFEQFLAAAYTGTLAAADREKLRQELEQAYAALARKIYENWQGEDLLRSSEQELHQKEEALLEHRRRLQTVLQHLPAMLMAFDQHHALSACNHEFERVTGFRAEEVIGKPMLELFELGTELRVEVLAAHPEEGGSYRGKEWQIRCKEGTPKSASWSNFSRFVRIQGWNNWIVGLDISSKIHAEKDLRSLADQLEAKNGELEAISLAVSHDLSGQISRISGHCSTLQELFGMALSPQCRELLRSIHEATTEITGRINALQRFTSLVSAELQPEEVDLSAIAFEIADRLKGNGQRPVTFRIEDGVTATGDPRLLRLALEQLLENAWNYTVGVQHPVIQFGTAEMEGGRSFYVSDNGPRRQAGPEFQPGPTDKPSHLCCGIGLATVQRIITLHRGRIWAADEAEKGGTLYFTV